MTHHVDLNTITLLQGGHNTREDGLCLLEAVAWFAGQPHSAAPPCVSPVLRAFGMAFNDGLDDNQRQRLIGYIPRLVGTAGDKEADDHRAWTALDWLVRECTPKWLRLAGLTEQADLLAGMPEINAATVPSIRAPLEAVRKDSAAARAAAWGAAWDAARAAARAAAGAAAGDAAWDAARAAAWDAAGAAAGDAAWAAAWDAAGAAAGAAAWDAARAAARKNPENLRQAAYDAAFAKLKPVADELNESAFGLLDRLIDAGAT